MKKILNAAGFALAFTVLTALVIAISIGFFAGAVFLFGDPIGLGIGTLFLFFVGFFLVELID